MTNPLRCVVDANVGIKLFLPDIHSVQVSQLFDALTLPDTEFFVPDLFYIECANIFWKSARAGIYDSSDLSGDIAALLSLSLRSIRTAELIADAAPIALTHQISAYDACYVALSARYQVPLLTLDLKLLRAMENSRFDVRSLTELAL